MVEIRDQSVASETDKAWQGRETARTYDRKRFTSLSGRFFNWSEKRVVQRLAADISAQIPVKRVLDVPCGTGRIAEHLTDLFPAVTCADISNEMMNVARDRLSQKVSPDTRFESADIFHLHFPDRSFEIVFCIRLLQHFSSTDRSAILQQLARVSNKFVVVNLMYGSGYYGALREIRKRLGAYTPKHAATANELEGEIASAGLRLVKRIYPQPYYNGNLWLLLEKQ